MLLKHWGHTNVIKPYIEDSGVWIFIGTAGWGSRTPERYSWQALFTTHTAAFSYGG